MLLFWPLYEAADPEWKTTEETQCTEHTRASTEKKFQWLWNQNWLNTLCFFWSYESLAFTCICSTAPTMPKMDLFQNSHFFFLSSTFKRYSQDKNKEKYTDALFSAQV